MPLFKNKTIDYSTKLIILFFILAWIFSGWFYIFQGPKRTLDIRGDKTVFMAEEIPRFTIKILTTDNSGAALEDVITARASGKMEVAVLDMYGKITNINSNIIFHSDGLEVYVNRPQHFIPGKYTILAKMQNNGQNITSSQDFRWGVLAINTDRGEYEKGQTANISMAVLNDFGEMVCDADVTLAITDPDGKVAVLSTAKNTIAISPECSFYGVTKIADYLATYKVEKIGTYQLTLTAKTPNGIRSIQDSFEAKNDFAFSVQRIGPTRLFPESKYQMAINITAGKNYTGPVAEHVPSVFNITPQKGMVKTLHGDTMELVWQTRFQKGKTYKFIYEFSAPNVSPAFYLLGKLKVGNFEERRFWQIAADKILSTVSMTAPTGAQSIAVGGTFAITCDPACTGTGANPDVVDNYQYSTVSNCSSGNTNIDTSAATADVISVGTNPETATNCGSTSDTITGRNAGTVYISCYSTEGANTARSSECISVTVTANPTVNQNHYRWRNDDDNEANATWGTASEDTATSTMYANRVRRLRLEAANTGSGSATNYTYRLEYGTNSDCTSGSWTQVTSVASCAAANLFCMAQSQLTDTSASTNVASGLTDTGAFTAGEQVESDSDTASLTIAASSFTENEYAFKINTSTPEKTTYYFRASNAGTPLDAYGSCAQLTTGPAQLNQVHYRWRDDFEAESGTTWQGNNEDTATTSVGISKVMRLRMEVSNKRYASSSQMYILQYGTGSDPTTGTWTTVPQAGSCGSAIFCMNASSLTEDAATTNINPGLTDGNTTFVAGSQKETTATTTHISIDTTKYTEIEYAFQVTSNAAGNTAYYFRLATTTGDGVANQLTTYSVTPQLTTVASGAASCEITQIQQKDNRNTYLSPNTPGSVTVTLDTAATAGNTLITGVAIDKASGTITQPTGFTLINKGEGGTSSGALAYKVAAGGETAITWNWAATEEGNAWVGEYSGLSSDPLDQSAENEANLSLATASLSTGTTGSTAQADELAIAFSAADSGNSVGSSRSWTNSFVTIAEEPVPEESGNPFFNVASSTLTSVGTVESTISFSGGSDEAYATVATFKVDSCATAPDLDQKHYRWRNNNGLENDATFTLAQDAPATDIGIGQVVRLRMEVSNEGTASSSEQYILQYGTGSDPTTGTWTTIPSYRSCSTHPFCMNDSNLNQSASSTTNVAGGLDDENTGFRAGGQQETNAGTAHISLDTSHFTEIEYSLRVTQFAATNTTYYFRLAIPGTTGEGVTFDSLVPAANADDWDTYFLGGAWFWETTGGSSGIWAGENGSETTWSGQRFTLSSVIPPGSTISSSTMTIRGVDNASWTSGDQFLQIYATDSSDGNQIISNATSTRPSLSGGDLFLTSASVRWPTAGALSWNSAGDNTTNDFSSVIQELVDDNNGLAKDAHVVVWLGTYPDGNYAGERTVAYAPLDHATLDPPRLTITYRSPTALDTYSQTPQLTTKALDWYNASWLYRKTVTIQSSKVYSDESFFPFLATTTDSNLSSSAQTDGDDILFTTADGQTKLNYELESYTSGTGAFVGWVQTDVASTTDLTLYMYYGNGSASAQSTTTGTWLDEYAGVFHMSNVYDSTKNRNYADNKGAATTTGYLNGAFDFERDDAGDAFKLPNSSSINISGTKLTLQQWSYFESDTGPNDNAMLAKCYNADQSSPVYQYGMELYWGNTDSPTFFIADSATTNHQLISLTAVSPLNNYYINSTYDGTYMTGYVNGGGKYSEQEQDSITARNNFMYIGSDCDQAQNQDGLIDEVRILNVARNEQWIETEYENFRAANEFISKGNQESGASGAFNVYASSSVSFDSALTSSFSSQTSTLSKVGGIKIEDDRGTSAGWTLNLTSADWKTTTGDMQLDYDGTGTNDNLGKMCANPAAGNLSAESGSLTNVNKGTLDCFGAGVATIDLVTASVGFGNGTYWLTDMSLGQYIPSSPTAAVYTTTIILTIQ